MSDERSDEQRAADHALEDAVARVAAAYGNVPDGFVLTNWIVLGAGAGVGMRDGHNIALGFHLMPDGGDHLDWHATLGLIRSQQLLLEHAYVQADDESGE